MSLTADQTATVVGELQWVSDRLATALSASSDPRLVATAAVFAEQASTWAAVLPESILLEPQRRVVPAGDEVAAVIDEAATSAEALAAFVRELVAAIETMRAQCGPVADGALARTAAEALVGLDHLAARLPAAGSDADGESRLVGVGLTSEIVAE